MVDPVIGQRLTQDNDGGIRTGNSDNTMVNHGSSIVSSAKMRARKCRDPEELARLGIRAPPNARPPKRSYTEEEDAGLLKGYSWYGPQWTTIQQDPDLHLEGRRPLGLRDRFRIRYPELYAQAGYITKPQDKVKPMTSSQHTETASKEVPKPFPTPPVVITLFPPLASSPNRVSPRPQHELPERPESEEFKKDPDQLLGVAQKPQPI